MPHILRDMPFFNQPLTAVVGGEVVSVRSYQIIVWITVTSPRLPALPPNAPRIPAILDTGLSHNARHSGASPAIVVARHVGVAALSPTSATESDRVTGVRSRRVGPPKP